MIYLFIWLHWVFVAARGLSAVVVSRGRSRVAAGTLLIVEASLLVEHVDSRAVGSVVVALQGRWDLPGPRIAPVFPALTRES